MIDSVPRKDEGKSNLSHVKPSFQQKDNNKEDTDKEADKIRYSKDM